MSTLEVGANAQYATIASAVAASNDGDVIQVQAGTYTNDFAEISHKITLEAVGGPVNMVATEPIPNGKAILITDTDVTINGFTFSGATVGDANGAGIRYQAGNLVIENSVFENNQNGILGGAVPGGTIDIENSEFINNGSGTGYTHGIYIGDIAKLTVNNSYFTGTNVGHEIKSRAETNVITNSRIQDGPNGTASYTIDLPNGGNDTITNDVIEKGANSQNPIMISYGEEGGTYANSQLTVSNDTLLYDHSASSSSVFVRNSTSAQATVSNDSYYGLSASALLSGTGTVSDDTALSTESALNTSSPADTDPSSGSTGSTGSSTTTTGSGGTTSTSSNSGSNSGSGTSTAPTGTSSLILYVSEDAYQGDAQFTVSVDGNQVGGVQTATASHAAGASQAITVPVTAGQHTISVGFLNDLWDGTPSTDRNLYVDEATLNGQTVSGSSLSLLSGGTQSFNVEVPSTTTTTSSGTSTSSSGTPPSTTTTTPPASNTPTSANSGSGLVLNISEDAYQGDAQFTVSVDGQQLGGVQTATASHAAGATQAITVPVTAGQHNISVDFLNDAWGGTAATDRNLYVDDATLNGQTVSGSSLTLFSAGTQSFNVQVPSTTPTPTSTLALSVSEDAWQGDAQMQVSVDGNVEGTYTVTALHSQGNSQTVTISGIPETLSPHDVAVSFLNDAWGGTAATDRNLYLNSMQFDGNTVAGASATFLDAGTQHFTVSAPANWGATA